MSSISAGNCDTFNVYSYQSTSLDEDLFISHYCQNSTRKNNSLVHNQKVILIEYSIVITSMFSFVLVHLALITRKVFYSPAFMNQHGFYLVLLEICCTFWFGVAYTVLLFGVNSWLSPFFMGVGWQFSMLWIHVFVYAMYQTIINHNNTKISINQ